MSLTSTANPLLSNSVGCCASAPSSQQNNAQTTQSSTGVNNVNLSSSSSASGASSQAAPAPLQATNSSAYSLNPSASTSSATNISTTPGSIQIPIITNTTTTSSIHVNPILHHMGEEKVYKKEKQIWLEFDTKSKGMFCLFLSLSLFLSYFKLFLY